MHPQSLNDFLAFCKKFDQAMLVTHSDRGLDGRPMMIADLDADATFWFATDTNSGKVDELKQDSKVCITMSGTPGHAFVNGTASLVYDRDKVNALWNESWRVWFPGGPTDSRLVLIRVETEQGQYWATSGMNGLQYLFSAVTAYIRGERPKEVEKMHGEVAL